MKSYLLRLAVFNLNDFVSIIKSFDIVKSNPDKTDKFFFQEICEDLGNISTLL